MSIFDYSTTPGSNTTINSININEGCAPGNLNNGIRQLMADLRSAFASGLSGFLAGSSALPVANGGTASTTATDARTALAAAKSGANSDITALSGLTTALSIAQGGTGATGAEAARTALGAQGALSFGSGGDGQYIGIRIGAFTYYLMWGRLTGYYPQGAAYTITLPVSLTDPATAAAQITAENSSGTTGTSGDCWAQVKNITTTTAGFVIQDSSGAASASGVHWFVIGK